MSKNNIVFTGGWVLLTMSLLLLSCSRQESFRLLEEKLQVHFSGDAKIETGGPYVGIEMHHSSFLPQRISFFHPVANSIDASSDFWNRDTTWVMAVGLRRGNQPKEWPGLEPVPFTLTPYAVDFLKQDSVTSLQVSYHFCENKPAMAVTFEITNTGNREESFEFETHLEASLRTSHTYRHIDSAWTDFSEKGSAVFVNFDNPETQNAQLFVANAAEQPVDYQTRGPLDRRAIREADWWKQAAASEPRLIPKTTLSGPAVRYLYKKKLAPSGKMTVVQIIGSARQNEGREIVDYLLKNYSEEIARYEEKVLEKTFRSSSFTIGDSLVDHSVYWAKAILAANAHYLYGHLVPMPCPAEYNFFFSHDVLMTDLAAVNFDLPRVKYDLQYIIDHANKDKVIPHAYYWKDNRYVTEFANEDNWNNYWMIIVSASYLRHGGDSTFVRTLYPYLTKSLQQGLLTKTDDDLIASYRPDWWDIGKNFAPRAYMTILAIRAIRDYLYVSSRLGENMNQLPEYEKLAARMHQQLVAKLWNEDMGYLANYYQDGSLDKHYYTGSLLAAHLALLDSQKTTALLQSARQHLLDEKLGIYDVYPMDFAGLKEKLKFVGNEAGDQFYYLNGGIWPHDNAWYALALVANNRREEAFRFIKTAMTLGGIMQGPNGQPAMYEVRNANAGDNSVYGTVDKPQFLWAGAWYLYTLYHLFGIRESEWNTAFAPFLREDQESVSFDLTAGGRLVRAEVNGSGRQLSQIRYDGNLYHSAVIPTAAENLKKVELVLGIPDAPYLENTTSMLTSCTWNEDQQMLNIKLHAFSGHLNRTTIVSPTKPDHILLNNIEMNEGWEVQHDGNVMRTVIQFTHAAGSNELNIHF